VFKEQPVLLEQIQLCLVQLDPKEFKDLGEKTVLLVLQVETARLEELAQLDLQALKELKAQLDLQALKELKAQRDQMAARVQLVHKEHQDLEGQKVLRDLLAQTAVAVAVAILVI
jgi:hypothetical protein